MAEPFDTLMEVQAHDTTLDQLRHRIESLPERLELREVEKRQVALRAAAVEVKAQVDDLAGRQRSLEDQIAAAAKRRHEIEQRMESGQVSASRDLLAMDQEVHRAESASRLPEELATRYDQLRARFGGVGAARLVGDRCDGCHLTLSSVE